VALAPHKKMGKIARLPAGVPIQAGRQLRADVRYCGIDLSLNYLRILLRFNLRATRRLVFLVFFFGMVVSSYIQNPVLKGVIVKKPRPFFKV